MMAPFLRVTLSAFWSMASALARIGVKKGWLRSVRLDSRVISVGNIQAGGAGKTPLVAQIAREGIRRGMKVAILCRGYGSRWEKMGGCFLPSMGESEARGNLVDAGLCGDEAVLLHELVPEAFIGVGADRVGQYRVLKEKTGVKFDLVILDDGFQHWRIQKDVEVVAITSASRWRLLYRDWGWALKNANLLVWTKGEKRPDSWHRPLVKIRLKVPSPGKALSIHLVTGVGDSFETRRSIIAAGYVVAKHLSFSDHAQYNREKSLQLVASAREAGCRFALTGKDWVKWREFGLTREDVLVLEPEVVFEEGRESWDQILWGG